MLAISTSSNIFFPKQIAPKGPLGAPGGPSRPNTSSGIRIRAQKSPRSLKKPEQMLFFVLKLGISLFFFIKNLEHYE